MFDSNQSVLTVLNTDAPPDIPALRRKTQLTFEEACETLGTLGEYLERVPVGSGHHLRDRSHVLVRNSVVEQIAHRVHEDHTRCAPPERIAKLLRDKPEVEPELEGMPRHTAKPFCKGLRVAVHAPRADLRAAAHGVPGGVGPFDLRLVTHARVLLQCPLRL